MKVNDLITRLRVMLGEETEVVEKVVEEKMAEAELVDGTQVYTEGALEPGAILFVRAGEGVSEDPFAPSGLHETTDGLLITVGENGEISSIEEKAPEAMEEVVEEEKIMENYSMDDLLLAIVELLKPYMEKMEEIKEEVSTLESRFNKVADEPAASSIKKASFTAMRDEKLSVAEQRFARLVELRKNGFTK